MKFFKTAAICVLSGIMAFSFVACSSGDKKEKALPEKDVEAINEEYDKVMDEIKSDGENVESVESDVSFNTVSFSSYDYSLYPPSDESAVYSLEKNTFGKVNLGGTYFNSIAPGGQLHTEAESFKTAKGLTVLNTMQEFIAAYAIEDGKALYKLPEGSDYLVLENGVFAGKLTAVYASRGNGEFVLLGQDETRKFLKIRDENADGMYFDPKLVNEAFSEYKSVAVLDLCVNDIGEIYEFSVCRFEESNPAELSH